MTSYPSDTFVNVHPFARRQEGDVVTIGDMQRQVFLSIPAEALVILDALAEGRTVAEAGVDYQDMYGESPDIEDFLEALQAAGFVEPRAATDGAAVPEPDGTAAAAPVGHFGWITPARARRLCQPAVLIACAAIVAVAVAMVAAEPSIIPSSTVLVFKRYLAALSLGMFTFGLLGVALHEVAHLVAARAVGVPARISVSHRLWMVVAETDMTGIWMASKRARYVAYLAGPLVDAVSGSFFIGVLWGQRHGWIALSPLQVQVVGACVMLYLLKLLWQCFVFVRTDFYYVVASALNCKNLLVDTQDFLNNCVARVRPSWRTVDQSAVPAAEMRVVRWYSLVWLAGRVAALGLLVVMLPIFWRYAVAIAPLLVGERSRYGVFDVVALGAVTVGVDGAGIYMWVRSLFRRFLERRSDAVAS